MLKPLWIFLNSLGPTCGLKAGPPIRIVSRFRIPTSQGGEEGLQNIKMLQKIYSTDGKPNMNYITGHVVELGHFDWAQPVFRIHIH